ncbi:DUF1841 family protein [Aquabacterium fontiphilum]|jgi:hypothetical protein|uniref:DUF1841 family protein n=1 Tax=Aquabacterium fontiphilum TaxID=450365 RepID=UPI0013782F1A|nr:DUF1841 family protein [Aquabacterium fontiphilum]NBD19836.1 DUF1841 family protein [Aquabacterium fontiphilum]
MFAPNQETVRRFFCQAWSQHRAGAPLAPMEALAVDWILHHPEYHDDLADVEQAVAAQFTVEEGRTNPFLHLSMHLSISEQVSIDQPRGIREAVERLAAKRGSLHEAHHGVMEALGETIWESQRLGRPLDAHAYLDRVRRLATSD